MPAKPFTVSSLLGRFQRDGRQQLAMPDQTYRVRYTVLSDEVFAALSRILLDKYLYGQTVDIDDQPFEIERVGIKADDTRGWGQVTSYQELYDGAGTTQEINLRFYSPTAFKTGDINLLFPLARSVFGSYARTWDTFAGLPLSDDLLDFVEAQVVASRYELETRVLHAGKYPPHRFRRHVHLPHHGRRPGPRASSECAGGLRPLRRHGHEDDAGRWGETRRV